MGLILIIIGPVVCANEAGLILPSHAGADVVVHLQEESTGIDPSHAVQVFVGKSSACCTNRQPIAGRYTINKRILTFDPEFDFIHGQSYTVMTSRNDSDNQAVDILHEFIIHPPENIVNPEVVAIYPSGEEIPENVLRFYILFSTPMQPHLSEQYIQLLDSNGYVVSNAFMFFKQELWSEDRKRLTLLIDPGRIKRGVAQNRRLGPALVEGNSYSIVVRPGWPRAEGAIKAPGFVKHFSVAKALRTHPHTEQWQYKIPQPLTRDPLIVEFDRPYDSQLLHKAISVSNSHGKILPGTVFVENSERTWRFEPDSEWTSAAVFLSVDARLEDVAGNNFREVFDHTLGSVTHQIDQLKIALFIGNN